MWKCRAIPRLMGTQSRKLGRLRAPIRAPDKSRGRCPCRRGRILRRQSRGSGSMLELMLCSLFTLLPDYLFRRYGQGKRFGEEINLYTVWFELRWGITGCLILTVLLITTVFYNHPSTTSATLYFRTIPILPETNGRVAEAYIATGESVAAGAPILRLDSSKQEAAVETAKR